MDIEITKGSKIGHQVLKACLLVARPRKPFFLLPPFQYFFGHYPKALRYPMAGCFHYGRIRIIKNPTLRLPAKHLGGLIAVWKYYRPALPFPFPPTHFLQSLPPFSKQRRFRLRGQGIKIPLPKLLQQPFLLLTDG